MRRILSVVALVAIGISSIPAFGITGVASDPASTVFGSWDTLNTSANSRGRFNVNTTLRLLRSRVFVQTAPDTGDLLFEISVTSDRSFAAGLIEDRVTLIDTYSPLPTDVTYTADVHQLTETFSGDVYNSSYFDFSFGHGLITSVNAPRFSDVVSVTGVLERTYIQSFLVETSSPTTDVYLDTVVRANQVPEPAAGLVLAGMSLIVMGRARRLSQAA
jgi:hypothetical protein